MFLLMYCITFPPDVFSPIVLLFFLPLLAFILFSCRFNNRIFINYFNYITIIFLFVIRNNYLNIIVFDMLFCINNNPIITTIKWSYVSTYLRKVWRVQSKLIVKHFQNPPQFAICPSSKIFWDYISHCKTLLAVYLLHLSSQ